MEQKAWYFDQTRCIGCYSCAVACKDWHDVPEGPSNWISIKTIEKGIFPNVFLGFLISTCYHCADPSCIKVCPTKAIIKRDDGIVEVITDRCVGKKCSLCLEACVYDAPQFREGENARMEKCDFCIERGQNGKKPICVAACKTRALDSGPIDQLKTKYGKNTNAEGFSYHPIMKPSILFKPKQK